MKKLNRIAAAAMMLLVAVTSNAQVVQNLCTLCATYLHNLCKASALTHLYYTIDFPRLYYDIITISSEISFHIVHLSSA